LQSGAPHLGLAKYICHSDSLCYAIWLSFFVSLQPVLLTAKPSTPVITNLEKSNCEVNLTWRVNEDARCPLTEYTIYYKQIYGDGTKDDSWSKIDIATVLVTHHQWTLQCGTRYQIAVSAWNAMGESKLSITQEIKTEWRTESPGNK